jgi:hypothetical protein
MGEKMPLVYKVDQKAAIVSLEILTDELIR